MAASETVRSNCVVGSPIHLEDASVAIRIAPAQLGEHTAEVLAEIEALPRKAAS